MAEIKSVITPAGAEQLEKEMREIKEVKLYEVAARIKEAREQGDITENAEYDAARDEQAALKQRYEEIREILKNAVIADDTDTKTVTFGSRVTVRKEGSERDEVYTVVGSHEVTSSGMISDQSPLGKALMNKKVRNKVTVEVPAAPGRPARVYTCTIKKIEKA